MTKRHIGDIIKQLRLDAGYSLSELSRRANVDISTLSRIERRVHHTITWENLARIAQALRTSVTEIERMMGGDNADPPPLSRWPTFEEVVNRDRDLKQNQRAALIVMYRAFLDR